MATPEQLRELAAQTRLWAVFERGMVLATGSLVSRHMRAGVKGYEGDGLLGMDLALEEAPREWFRLLIPHYSRVGKMFGDRMFQQLGIKGAFEEFEEGMMAWIQSIGVSEAKALGDSTKLALRGLIEAGQAEGLSTRAIASNIRKQISGLSRVRAQTIARTEVHNAASFSGQLAARSSGFEMEKKWLAHPAGRTRLTHLEAGASDWRELDAPYDVGGSRMMHPGDGSLGAGAEEIVNCRCGELRRTKRG